MFNGSVNFTEGNCNIELQYWWGNQGLTCEIFTLVTLRMWGWTIGIIYIYIPNQQNIGIILGLYTQLYTPIISQRCTVIRGCPKILGEIFFTPLMVDPVNPVNQPRAKYDDLMASTEQPFPNGSFTMVGFPFGNGISTS